MVGKTKDGRKKVIELLLTEVTDPSGKEERLFLAVLNDITGESVSEWPIGMKRRRRR